MKEFMFTLKYTTHPQGVPFLRGLAEIASVGTDDKSLLQFVIQTKLEFSMTICVQLKSVRMLLIKSIFI
jgi:hypothetical protein